MEHTLLTKPDEMATLLTKALIKQSLVKQSVIEDLLQKRDEAVDAAKKEIQGTCYLVDYHEKKLKIFDTYTGEVFHSVTLPWQAAAFNPDDFDNWGNAAAILDLAEMQKEGEIFYDLKSNYGLVIKDNISYLYNPGLDRQNLLGLTSQYICGAIPRKAKTRLPYDMYFSADYSLLCLSNRDEGKIYLFDIESSRFTDEVHVRNPGSNKAINLSISVNHGKIYITDSLSTHINIYDITEQSLTKRNLNTGVLGNLCLSPDEKSIYLITTKPEQNLKNISLEDFSEIKSFPPKGELFSIGDAPCDLLVLSPDKNYLFSMTFINDPAPFTPVISVIDIEKNKPVKRFSIKDDIKPINLCFKAKNPVGEVNRSLEEMLIENRLFSINKLRDLKDSIMNGGEDEPEQAEERKKVAFIQVEGESLEFELRHDQVTAGAHGGVFPREINHVFIPPGANKHIREILLNTFWQQHEIDLNEVTELKESLEKVVEKVRVKLEYFDLEIVEVKGFYDKKLPLEGIILREYILEMLDEEESANRKKIKTVPTNCPNCGAPLLGAWECTTCGFVLEKPEDALRRKIASADPLVNIAKGNFLLVDPHNGVLFEIDSFKIPVWKASKKDLGLKSITTALRLENMNTLILDGEAGVICEITPKGRNSWSFKLSETEIGLNNPSFFTIVNSVHFLIADTGNHRVMEVDSEGNIIWQYGKFAMPGIKANFLKSPSYVQKTFDGTYLITDTGNNRVIELTRFVRPDTGKYEMRIDWKYGNELNIAGGGKGYGENQLNSPGMALKDLAGNILILDCDNKRLIEVNQENEVNWQYNTVTGQESSDIYEPSGFTRLKNKDILLVGNGKYVQFSPAAENRIVWISNLEELSAKTGFRILKEDITSIKVSYGSSGRYGKRFPQPRRKEPEELEKELRDIIAAKMKEATIAPPTWEDSEKPLAFPTEGATFLPMPIMLIDKINNKVMLADRKGDVYWSYGDNKVEKLIRVKMAEITPEKTILITNARGLLEITNEKIWGYDCQAESAVRLKNGNTLISDSKKFRVIEINKDKRLVWEHYHISERALASYAQRLLNGNTLITYSSTHIVVEVNQQHKIVWSFGENKISAKDNKHLCFPEYASRLDNGNTLIADSKNSRIIEVSPAGNIVWAYYGLVMQKLVSPNYASRLKDGHTYIVHGGNRQILEVDHTGKLLWRLVLPLKK